MINAIGHYILLLSLPALISVMIFTVGRVMYKHFKSYYKVKVKGIEYWMELEKIDQAQRKCSFDEWCTLQKVKEAFEFACGKKYPPTVTKTNKNYPTLNRFDL